MEHIDHDIPEEKPTMCPKCGNKNLLDGWLIDDIFDEKRANEYGVNFGDDFEKVASFFYVYDWVYCNAEIPISGDDYEDCDYQSDYGQRYYYNPKNNEYDLPRPPTPKEKKPMAHGNPRDGFHLLMKDGHSYACEFEMPDDAEVVGIHAVPTCDECKMIYDGIQQGLKDIESGNTLPIETLWD